jgi:CubicO group peptidase (beta-lactamase class C family)
VGYHCAGEVVSLKKHSCLDHIIESYSNLLITPKEFFTGFLRESPAFLPSTTPVYSNAAFIILSYALENITGRAFSTMLDTDIISRLDLARTTLVQPNDTTWGVIPFDESFGDWSVLLGDASP